jgi:DnaJ-class molecular chaperone
MRDFYEILGVPRSASVGDIRKAYAKVAREGHPDRFADPAEKARAQEVFQEATEAFNTLSNERARGEYDAELDKPKLVEPADIAADMYGRALQRMEAKDLTGAVELLRGAVYHMPGEAKYHAALGRAFSKDSRFAREAAQALEEAVRLDATNASVHADLALLYASQGLSIRARKSIEMALQIAPNDPQVVRIAAHLGVGSGDDQPPRGGFRGILRRKP